MKKITLLFLTLLMILSVIQPGQSQVNESRMFMFGHSLMDHRPPLYPTPSNETTIPHWIYLLAQQAGKTYTASGQYGFLPQHRNLPPIAQWGYDIVPGAWDSDYEPFSDADFTTILITAGNFMQWQPPHFNYYGENFSPIDATRDIVDWVDQETNGATYYIYENWPDMSGYLGSGFPPTAAELQNYHNGTRGAFHQWWLAYHDSLLLSRPDQQIRMIPVGPIMANLLSDTLLYNIPVTELYEDDAPHGRPTVYFLAGLITYMAVYQEPAPSSYPVPATVHDTLRTKYTQVVDYIWNELNSFTDASGNNRVFFNAPLPVTLASLDAQRQVEGVRIRWSTSREINHDRFELEHAVDGQNFKKVTTITNTHTYPNGRDYAFIHQDYQLGTNYYRLRQMDINGQVSYSKIISVDIRQNHQQPLTIYPNPATDNTVNIRLETRSKDPVSVRLYTLFGELIEQQDQAIQSGLRPYEFYFDQARPGLWLLEVQQGGRVFTEKVSFQ